MWVLLAAILLQQDRTPEQLIEDLRSPKIGVRAEARIQLKKLGKAALPALENAVHDSDAELSESSKLILREIKEDLAAEASREVLQSGRDKLGRKEFDAALADFNRALEIHPRSVEGFLGRGAALQGKGERE